MIRFFVKIIVCFIIFLYLEGCTSYILHKYFVGGIELRYDNFTPCTSKNKVWDIKNNMVIRLIIERKNIYIPIIPPLLFGLEIDKKKGNPFIRFFTIHDTRDSIRSVDSISIYLHKYDKREIFVFNKDLFKWEENSKDYYTCPLKNNLSFKDSLIKIDLKIYYRNGEGQRKTISIDTMKLKLSKENRFFVYLNS